MCFSSRQSKERGPSEPVEHCGQSVPLFPVARDSSVSWFRADKAESSLSPQGTNTQVEQSKRNRSCCRSIQSVLLCSTRAAVKLPLVRSYTASLVSSLRSHFLLASPQCPRSTHREHTEHTRTTRLNLSGTTGCLRTVQNAKDCNKKPFMETPQLGRTCGTSGAGFNILLWWVLQVHPHRGAALKWTGDTVTLGTTSSWDSGRG